MSFSIKRSAGLVITLAGVICGSGCASLMGPFAANIKSRVHDFHDPVSGGIGLGLGASARVTNYVQGGALYTIVKNSFRGREIQSPIKASPELGMSPLFHMRSIDNEESGFDGRAVLAGKTFVDASDERWKHWAVDEKWQWIPYRSDYAANYDRHLLDIGISIYGGVGGDFSINLIETPYEVLDFFIGLGTLGFVDIAGDDYTWEGPKLLDTVDTVAGK